MIDRIKDIFDKIGKKNLIWGCVGILVIAAGISRSCNKNSYSRAPYTKKYHESSHSADGSSKNASDVTKSDNRSASKSQSSQPKEAKPSESEKVKKELEQQLQRYSEIAKEIKAAYRHVQSDPGALGEVVNAQSDFEELHAILERRTKEMTPKQLSLFKSLTQEYLPPPEEDEFGRVINRYDRGNDYDYYFND